MRIRDRIRYNFGSNTLGFLINGVGQLLLIPTFLRHWSPALMGEWMVLWSVPAMIWAVEQMMTGAAINRMIRWHAQGEVSVATKCLHHILFLHAYLGLALLGLSLLCCFALPIAAWFKLEQISASDAQHISALIFVYMILVILANIIRMPFTAVGKPWLGNLHQAFTSLAVLLVQIVILWNSGTAQPVFLASGMLGTHALCLGGLIVLFYAFCNPYSIAWKRPTAESLKTIMGDNLPLTGFVFSQSLMVQSFTISIQLALGAYYVSAFSILKTLSRTFYQASNIVLAATGPELTAALARRDLLTIKKINFLQLTLILPGFFIFTCLALLFHEPFIRWWTHGKVSFSNQEILIFLIGVFFLVLWFKQSQLLLAMLRHHVFFWLAIGLSLFYSGSVFGLRSLLSFDVFLMAASLFEICLYIISRIQSQLAKARLYQHI